MENAVFLPEKTNKEIGSHTMINNGLCETAANGVLWVIDEQTATAYAAYLSSESALGESSELVNLTKFNVMQPTNARWVTVFDKHKDFEGHRLSECNIIDLDKDTVRVFAVDTVTCVYYYKDVDKKTLAVGEQKAVAFKGGDASPAVSFSLTNINEHLQSIGGEPFKYLQFTTEILNVDGYYYTSVCGGNAVGNFLFMLSKDGESWTVVSLVRHMVNYEAMLAYHDHKFWAMCRCGTESVSSTPHQNLMYSDDGIVWTKSNLSLITSDTRPCLFSYQGELCLAYSSPLPNDFSTVRPWRCNLHVGRIVTTDQGQVFEEMLYKESKFGIVYYMLKDWYGKLIMLYSSGELHPTEGLMSGWSQGKDCLNYTILQEKEPRLAFKA